METRLFSGELIYHKIGNLGCSLILILFALNILGCNHFRTDNTISVWGSYFEKGDTLKLLINDKVLQNRIIKENYKFTITKEKPICKYHFIGDSTKINLSINNNDTTFLIDNKTIKTIVIGRDIYGSIMIDYEFSNGKRTFTIE
jgi:hypothetical protein